MIEKSAFEDQSEEIQCDY